MAMANDAGEHHGEPAAPASGDLSTVAAISIEPPASSHDGTNEWRIRPEAAGGDPAGASSATQSAGLQRTAIPTGRPDEQPGAPGAEPVETTRITARAGGRRFALLAAGLKLAAAIGAIA